MRWIDIQLIKVTSAFARIQGRLHRLGSPSGPRTPDPGPAATAPALQLPGII